MSEQSKPVATVFHYGFTCGDEGMDFLTIRQGEASVDV